jgi:hypothetical protein
MPRIGQRWWRLSGIADAFGIPKEQARKRGDQEFSRCKAPYELHDDYVLDVYLPITIIQTSSSATTESGTGAAKTGSL